MGWPKKCDRRHDKLKVLHTAPDRRSRQRGAVVCWGRITRRLRDIQEPDIQEDLGEYGELLSRDGKTPNWAVLEAREIQYYRVIDHLTPLAVRFFRELLRMAERRRES